MSPTAFLLLPTRGNPIIDILYDLYGQESRRTH